MKSTVLLLIIRINSDRIVAMKEYARQLNLLSLLKKKSFFLLGPRATGKSYLIEMQLKAKAIVLNLLRTELYLRLLSTPGELEAIIDAELVKHEASYIVIDEVQKIPALLDEVHRLIESRRFRFLLTGSSARKLKRGGANLLAGRAWVANLYPLSFSEIPKFNLAHYLRYGGLPSVYASEFPEEELSAYVNTYLYEEIQAESLVRKIPQFSRFLEVAALTNGQLINFAKISSNCEVPASTIREYYTLLEDTLIGFTLPAWNKSKKRKAITTSKFYFFDCGVVHTLAGTKNIDRNSNLYGNSFEHWIALELRSYLGYRRKKEELCFWRSTHNHEVDFVIGDQVAVEVKSTQKINDYDLKGIRALQEENKIKKFIIVSQDKIETKKDNIHCMHWETFMKLLWEDKIF